MSSEIFGGISFIIYAISMAIMIFFIHHGYLDDKK